MILSPTPSRHEFTTSSPSQTSAAPHIGLSISANPSYSSFSELYADQSPTPGSATYHSTAPSSSKTAAFFASPYSPTPPPSAGSKTNAFFSSSFSVLPTPPASSSSSTYGDHLKPTRSRTDDFFHPRSVSSPVRSSSRPPSTFATSRETSPAPSTSRSRTNDFFSTTKSDGPSPPPSLRSASSVSSFTHSVNSHTSPLSITTPLEGESVDQDATPSLPPLARFFPSRYASVKDDDDILPSSLTQSPKRRGFVEIDEGSSADSHSHSSPASPYRAHATDLTSEPTSSEAPSRKSPLPPLARLFPSRYASIADKDLTESPPSSASPSRREFIDIEEPIAFVSSPIDAYSRFPGAQTQPSEDRPLDQPLVRESARLAPLSRLFPSRYSSIASQHEDSFVGPSNHHANVPRENHVSTPAEAFRSGSILKKDEADSGYQLVEAVGQGAFSSVWKAKHAIGGVGTAQKELDDGGKLVAVKMIAKRASHLSADRTRASFVREADVLQHLAKAPHPSLPVLHAAFTLNSHYVIVLEYFAGGELFDAVNSDEQHARLTEPILSRMWTELVSAVAWMHTHCVVHRDIKLENILFTNNPLLDESALETSGPLIKLTDFGLARVIDPTDPWLTTRCGSESYAAPELLLAGSHGAALALEEEESISVAGAPTIETFATSSSDGDSGVHVKPITPRKEGTYDGRETDAWALGVVLFAIVTRQLPFDPDAVEVAAAGRGGMTGSLRRKEARKAWKMKIVKGEYKWPEDSELLGNSASSTVGVEDEQEGEDEPKGTELAMLDKIRDMVGRLLVTDPSKRAKVTDLAAEGASFGAFSTS